MNATKGAMKAAEIIIGDKHRIRTDYGEKTIYGLADLIDRETTAPELLEALKGLFEHCAMVHNQWGDNSNQKEADNAIKAARAAISKAEGGAQHD